MTLHDFGCPVYVLTTCSQKIETIWFSNVLTLSVPGYFRNASSVLNALYIMCLCYASCQRQPFYHDLNILLRKSCLCKIVITLQNIITTAILCFKRVPYLLLHSQIVFDFNIKMLIFLMTTTLI